MSQVVRLQQLDAIPVVVIKRQATPAELSRVVPECCGLVWNALRAQQLRGGRNIALYWDSAIRTEVGVEMSQALNTFAEKDGVVRSSTPAGEVATITHFGPYGGLGAAHDAIHQWARSQSRNLAGPRWEIYGHWQQEWNTDPSQIRTDVYYLLH